MILQSLEIKQTPQPIIAEHTDVRQRGIKEFFTKTEKHQVHQILEDVKISLPDSRDESRQQTRRAPWHFISSQEDSWSVTSSIRDWLMSKIPLMTPVPEAQYIGQNGKRYPKGKLIKEVDIVSRRILTNELTVDLVDPTDASFLPSVSTNRNQIFRHRIRSRWIILTKVIFEGSTANPHPQELR
jgi:hypothetical protein